MREKRSVKAKIAVHPRNSIAWKLSFFPVFQKSMIWTIVAITPVNSGCRAAIIKPVNAPFKLKNFSNSGAK